MTCEATEPQQQYTHSLKLEDTAKGIRISVHVYANSTGEAIEQAFTMYLKAKDDRHWQQNTISAGRSQIRNFDCNYHN